MPFLLSIGINLIIGLVLSIGSTLLQQALFPKKQQQANAVSGFRGQVQTGGQVPQSFLIGTIGSAGKLEYRSAWGASGGTPNAYLVDVISFGDLSIAGTTPQAMWVDTQPVTVSATSGTTQGYPVTEYASSGDHLWWRGFDGSQTTADTYLTGKFGSDADRPWLTDMIGRGLPLLTVTALVSDTLWTSFPAVVVEWQGIKLFDPRLSTAAGGSGTQVWGTASTYTFSDNNMVAIYNVLRGIYDDEGNHVWGGNNSEYQMPYAVWAAAMDACDEDIALAAGGTEKRFRCGREIFLNERPADVVQELLTGCNGRIAWANGQCFPLVGLPSSADGTFTDADVLASESITQTPFPNLDDVINGGTASYMEPSQAWEFKETAPYTVADYVTADDSRKQTVDLKLTTTFSGTQAQRVLKATVEEGRRFLKWAVALTPGFGQYRPLQVLAWTSTENQYTAKLFLIVARTIDPWGNVFLGLQEIDPADHDWTAATDEQALSFAPMTPVTPTPQDVADFAVAPYVITSTGSVPFKPAIQFFWDGTVADVRALLFEVRLADDESLVLTGEFATRFADGTGTTPGGALKGNTEYEARGKYDPFSARETEWTDWLSVTTPDVPEVALPDSVVAFQDWIGVNIRELNEQAQLQSSGVADQDLANYGDKLYVVDQQRIGDNIVTAGYTKSILLALGADDSSLADAIEAVDASSGDIRSGLTIRGTAFASPGGGWARYGFQVRTDVSVEFSATASMYLEAKSDGTSRIVLKATETNILDDAGNVLALFKTGGAYFSTARIQDADITGAKIANAAITSAKIGNLEVERIKIDDAAVTDLAASSVSSTSWAQTTSPLTLLTINITTGDYPIVVGAYIDETTHAAAPSQAYFVDLICTTLGITLDSYSSGTQTGGVAHRLKVPLRGVMPPLPAGTYTISLRVWASVVTTALPHTVTYASVAAAIPHK